MGEKALVPKLRFNGFDNHWKEIPLHELISFKNGLNASKEQYGFGTKFINVSDILDNEFITYENINDSVQVSDSEFENYKIEYGDIVFQRSSENREEVGTANVYLSKKPCIYGGFVIRGKKKGNYDPYFLKELLQSTRVRKEITSWSGGSTRYNIGQDSLKKIHIILPLIEEQQLISHYICSINKKIQLLNQKHESYLYLKKYLIQQIFSKKLRFNFKDEWKKAKLNEFLKERKKYAELGEYPHVTLSKEGIQLKTDRYNRDFLVKEDNKKYKITQLGDICYNPANLKFGVITLNKFGSALFSPIYVTFEVNNINKEFLAYYLIRNDFINKVRRFEEGTVYERMAVKPSDFVNETIYIPSLQEQEKIVNLLSNFDKKILSIDNMISDMNKFKKGIIQKMFV